MCWKFFNKNVKKRFGLLEVKLSSLGTAALVLFVFSFWAGTVAVLRWIWLVVAILALIRPFALAFKKK